MAGKNVHPLYFKNGFGLNRNQDSHFVDTKKLFLVFLFRGNSSRMFIKIELLWMSGYRGVVPT